MANAGSNNISVYRINAATGALAPVPGSPFPAGMRPHSIAVTPSGRFVYVTNEGPVPDYLAPGPILSLGSISAYSVNATTGALTPFLGSPYPAEGELSKIVVTPSGEFVYIATVRRVKRADVVTGDSGISAYAIDATAGTLTPVSGSPFWMGGVASLTVDPAGRFLYATRPSFRTGGDEVWAYNIDSTTGALTPVPGSPFQTRPHPQSILVEPSGRFVYVANTGGTFESPDPSLSAYAIDPTTGTLAPVPGSPFPVEKGAVTHSVTIDPSGRFLYAANSGARNISAYTLDATTGALTSVPGSPYLTGGIPTRVTGDRSGHFVYVTTTGSPQSPMGSVLAYTVDSTTGALTPVRGSPFPAGHGPRSVTTTGRIR